MIIADTGFWLALANSRDKWHRRCVLALDSSDEPLITTWPVVTETCHLLTYRLGSFAMLAFMKSLMEGAFEIFELPKDSKRELYQLMRKYRDLPMDLADASLLLLADHLGHGRIFSTDQRDFRTYKWKHRKPFQNLLELN